MKESLTVGEIAPMTEMEGRREDREWERESKR